MRLILKFQFIFCRTPGIYRVTDWPYNTALLSLHSCSISPSPFLRSPASTATLTHSLTACGCMMAKWKRSAVWSFFTATNQTTATCNVCRKEIRYCGNTTNLHKHIKTHPNQNSEQRSLAETFQAMDITRSLAKMIVKDIQPVSVFEDEGFRNFVKTLDHRYKIPSRKTLMEEKIPALYEECRSKVRKVLDAANSVVLTTDMWTSRATEAYLTVSCHVIDENWQMQAYVLQTSSFSGKHSADNICSELKRITNEWGITAKVHAVITANGAHYPCFAHTLNLVVKDSIKVLPDLLDIQRKCSAIVAFFHHSTRAAERLKEIQKQLKLPEHKLIQSVEKRWNSVFYMFERLLEQKEAVTTVLCLCGKSSLCLSEEDWSMVSLSIDALRQFEEVTKEISTEKHASVSKVIPLVTLLRRSTATHESQGIKLAAELSSQCQHRFRAIETFYGLAVSTFLDTRFKNLGLTCSATSSVAVAAPATTSNSPAAKGGIWAEFDSQVLASQEHRTPGTDAFIEMRRYSEEKPIPRDGDPLLWWKTNEPTFPSLSKLAKKHLTVIATSVPAERIFSKAGQLVSERRSSIKGKNVNIPRQDWSYTVQQLVCVGTLVVYVHAQAFW
uniref:BED-type domain-containing protein n=1 Tax=Seriola dumerili TaxID=41447 RepID=A0A3B4TRY0_SERDU